MAAPVVDAGPSAFKRAQMRYKRQASEKCIEYLNECIDFSFPDQDDRIVARDIIGDDDDDIYAGPYYGLHSHPGFLYAPQALESDLQLEIAYQAVNHFCQAPHGTNIDLVPPKPNEEVNADDDNMWEQWKNERQSNQQQKKKLYRSFRKLSWATCGYQYDWTKRAYHEKSKSRMPQILEQLSVKFAKASLLLEKAPSTKFTPSASICNYYTIKSTMGGHVDDLELAQDKPVVSLSLGLPGIFLLGGKTKNDTTPAAPILVRPGDVLLLGGDCRLNVHGLARVVGDGVIAPPIVVAPPNSRPLKWKALSSNISSGDKEHLEAFLKEYRININVRQVLTDGMESMPEQTQA